ncbi:MAG: phosphocholine cytidylyltransferase family protein [Planctomycetes bacterium]|nr:phosphocholine cytidylyltransferase family protein [Planctomycetota bacterium]
MPDRDVQAVILAAGRGTRLGSILNGKPKCMLEVGGRTLIQHQIHALTRLGITRIGVVVGHGAEYVREHLGDSCHYIENEIYAETNSLYSLWLTREWVDSPFVLMNSDVLAHPEIIARVASVSSSVLAYDSTSGDEDEHMKISLSSGRVSGLSKTMRQDAVSGENVGILKFGKDAIAPLMDAAEQIVTAGNVTCWAPAAVDAIAKTNHISAVDISDLCWVEIDYPEDLDKATSEVWPTISDEHVRQGGHIRVVSNGSGHPAPQTVVRSNGHPIKGKAKSLLARLIKQRTAAVPSQATSA